MSAREVLAIIGVGLGVAAFAAILIPRPPPLRNRVRPYAILARTSLGHTPGRAIDLDLMTRRSPKQGIFEIPVRAFAARLGRIFEQRGDEQLTRLLRQAGMGIAIAILLLFEMLMGLLQAAPGAPLVAWGMAIGLYAIYLAVIVTALRPAAVAVRVTDSNTGVPLSDRTASQ